MDISENQLETYDNGKQIKESREMTSFYSDKGAFQGSETEKGKRRTTKKILM